MKVSTTTGELDLGCIQITLHKTEHILLSLDKAEELRDGLNRAIAEIRRGGKYAELVRK